MRDDDVVLWLEDTPRDRARDLLDRADRVLRTTPRRAGEQVFDIPASTPELVGMILDAANATLEKMLRAR